MIFISIIDVKTGLDEEAYTEIESLGPNNGVTPLLIGRIFEESDILILLHSENLESVDDYLIKYVRKSEAAEELTLIPIYDFSLLPSFDSVTEPTQEPIQEEEILSFLQTRHNKIHRQRPTKHPKQCRRRLGKTTHRRLYD